MKKNASSLLVIAIAIVVFVFFISAQFSKASGGTLKMYFFDVGQGDAILIRTPSNKDILVDGGPDNTILERLNEALPFWDRYIDLVILTHPHADHINGLFDVLERYKVGKVLEPDLINEPENMIYFNRLVNKARIEDVAKLIMGDKIVFEQGVEIEFFYPFSLQLSEKDLNDTSLVFKLSYGEIDFLFTGDATEKVEQKILEHNLDVEFLKVGHHGSRYSSSGGFLGIVSPAVSIISVGENNSFGHPTGDALGRLDAVGSRVLRTDMSGSVKVEVESDGEWEIKCEKGCD